MIYQFKTRYLRISPRKMRFLSANFKDKKALELIEILSNSPEKAARLILKSLNSAIASLKNQGVDEEDLKIKNILVDEGPRLKRRQIKPRGRADIILKRMSHLTIVLQDKRKKRKKEKQEIDRKSKI
ncbi:MAG: large subunit ribosomal protein L22 [Candidatus Berkelbacteria bacterium Licking1014_96]|uniref:Large ribosomal subunit protein uL22 n=1 Tax=Candidatus Berkelbacteria bacterium Licking1014_96 TaxID=2017149 RepID=A0A554LE68_9BACT|nr:MAG: large subunit ribosomal protein L22 [Candidatus Berkelbacteria bacterium Licking1014_96]